MLMAPVGFPNDAGIPPHVAQVPMAMVTAASGARRRTHSDVDLRWRWSAGAHSGKEPLAANGSAPTVRFSSVIDRLVDDDVGRVEGTSVGLFQQVGEVVA